MEFGIWNWSSLLEINRSCLECNLTHLFLFLLLLIWKTSFRFSILSFVRILYVLCIMEPGGKDSRTQLPNRKNCSWIFMYALLELFLNFVSIILEFCMYYVYGTRKSGTRNSRFGGLNFFVRLGPPKSQDRPWLRVRSFFFVLVVEDFKWCSTTMEHKVPTSKRQLTHKDFSLKKHEYFCSF